MFQSEFKPYHLQGDFMNKFFSILMLGASFAVTANEVCQPQCEPCPSNDAQCTPCEKQPMPVTEESVRNVLEHNGQVSFVISFKCMEGCNPEKRDQICSMVMDCVNACQNSDSKNPMKDIMPIVSEMCDVVSNDEMIRGEMSMFVGIPNAEGCPASDCSSCPADESCCPQPAA
jgi:hypothetical protein